MDRRSLESLGFAPFVTFGQLIDEYLPRVPNSPGAYVVVRDSRDSVAFLDRNPGGRFKGRDPTVDTALLRRKWVDGSPVVYIGKAKDLRRRLREYARFGQGAPIGHWGGRYVWQLADSSELRVAWVECAAGQTEHGLEAQLIRAFKARYGRLPFANIADVS